MGFIEDLQAFFEDIHNISEDDIGNTFLSLWGNPLVTGINLFFYYYPETPDDVIIIFPRSRPNVIENRPSMMYSFDFLVRSKNKHKAFKTAEFLTLLFDKRGRVLSRNSISYVGSATPSPFYLDEKGRQAFRNYVWFNAIKYDIKDLTS